MLCLLGINDTHSIFLKNPCLSDISSCSCKYQTKIWLKKDIELEFFAHVDPGLNIHQMSLDIFGILGQVWYLIVLIPDPCCLSLDIKCGPNGCKDTFSGCHRQSLGSQDLIIMSMQPFSCLNGV